MNSLERRSKIVNIVNTQGSVLVLDLSNPLGISEITIHADSRLLEEKELLIHFYDDAVYTGSDLIDTENQKVVLEDRYQFISDPKKRTAQIVIAMIRESMMVIPDSGSTTLLIAKVLVRMINITIITNSLPAASTLAENKDITLVVYGGTVWHKTHSMHRTIAEHSSRGICADLMFVGADGIGATNGITVSNEDYSISSMMATVTHQMITVLDVSKLNRRGFNQVLPIEETDCVIIDDSISENDRAALSSKKMELKAV